MPNEIHEAGSPGEWLRYAHSDLELSRVQPPPGVLLEGLCFHAHQAAEKALKAVLISLAVQFPKTHSIRMLLDLEAVRLAEEGGFFACCPEVPDANGQGETREETLNNLREAIAEN